MLVTGWMCLFQGECMLVTGWMCACYWVDVCLFQGRCVPVSGWMCAYFRVDVCLFQGGCYRPVLTDQLRQEGVELKCVATQKEFKPQALTLYRRQVTLVSEPAARTCQPLHNALHCRSGLSFDESFSLAFFPRPLLYFAFTKAEEYKPNLPKKVCRDKHTFVTTNTRLSRQNIFCHDKSILVKTKLSSQ